LSADKTTITVNRDLLLKISKIARSRGVTLTSYISNLLKSAYELSQHSYCPLDLMLFLKLYKALIPMDPVPIPLSLLTKILSDVDVNKYLEDVREIGEKVGAYLKQYMDLNELMDSLYVLREVNIVKEIRIENQGLNYRVTFIGSTDSDKGAVLLKEFIEGFLSSLEIRDYKIYTNENIVDIHFSLPKEYESFKEEVESLKELNN